jgi:hypothetical protein
MEGRAHAGNYAGERHMVVSCIICRVIGGGGVLNGGYATLRVAGFDGRGVTGSIVLQYLIVGLREISSVKQDG